jgi:hypothetical protein
MLDGATTVADLEEARLMSLALHGDESALAAMAGVL